MERLFIDLNQVTGKQAVDSVHLTEFPKADPTLIDKDLEERMEIAQKISSMVLSIRKKTNLRVRQPLNKILLPLLNQHLREQVEAVKNLILSEVNVKQLEYISDTSGILVKKIKPDFKKLGPKYGKLMKEIASTLASISQDDIIRLEKDKKLGLSVKGQLLEITLDDVEIQSEDIPGWQVANMGPLTVALDISISPELWQEGIAREIINRIQNLRKEKGFDVTDKINVKFQAHPEITLAVNHNISYICTEILAQSFDIVESIEDPDKNLIELNEQISTYISIKKID
jgi:isoleucyl-tRNA synthetase